MSLLANLLLVMCTLVTLCSAKFEHNYAGIASEGVQACIDSSDFTRETITLRSNCGNAYACIMDNISNSKQSILSSGTSILALVPTVLLVLGSPNEDVIRISARYPILAFFLAITCINKRPQMGKMRCKSPDTIIDLGPYGTIDQSAPNSNDPYTTQKRRHNLPVPARYGIPIAHLLACIGAGAIVWSTVDLAFHTVVTWACWTYFYPIIWLALAVVHHILAVISIRCSLELPARVPTAADDATQTSCTELVPIGNPVYLRSPIPSAISLGRTEFQPQGDCEPLHNTQNCSDDGQVRGLQLSHLGAKSALLVCDLGLDSVTVNCTHKRWAELSKACMDLLNNATYLYGTAIFSSLTMISGHNAIKVLGVYATVAVVSRVIADWVLEEIGGTGSK